MRIVLGASLRLFKTLKTQVHFTMQTRFYKQDQSPIKTPNSKLS